jgi:hypothetical protein
MKGLIASLFLRRELPIYVLYSTLSNTDLSHVARRRSPGDPPSYHLTVIEIGAWSKAANVALFLRILEDWMILSGG